MGIAHKLVSDMWQSRWSGTFFFLFTHFNYCHCASDLITDMSKKKILLALLMFNTKPVERKETGTEQENAWLSSSHYLIRASALQCLKHELHSHLVHNLTEMRQGQTQGSSQSGLVMIIKIAWTNINKAWSLCLQFSLYWVSSHASQGLASFFFFFLKPITSIHLSPFLLPLNCCPSLSHLLTVTWTYTHTPFSF